VWKYLATDMTTGNETETEVRKQTVCFKNVLCKTIFSWLDVSWKVMLHCNKQTAFLFNNSISYHVKIYIIKPCIKSSTVVYPQNHCLLYIWIVVMGSSSALLWSRQPTELYYCQYKTFYFTRKKKKDFIHSRIHIICTFIYIYECSSKTMSFNIQNNISLQNALRSV
jgi:hypothetical protein